MEYDFDSDDYAFFCENCGNIVDEDTPQCPVCGMVFIGTRDEDENVIVTHDPYAANFAAWELEMSFTNGMGN